MSTTDEKLALTQAEIDAMIGERVERDRKARGWSDDDAKALKTFRDAEKNKAVEEAKKQQDFEKAQQLRDAQHQEAIGLEKKRADDILGRYKGERITNALLAAAASAISPEQVSALLRERVTLDDDFKPVVLDANGKPTTKTVQQLVSDFLGEHKHFVKASSAGQHQGTAGAGGSSGSDRGGADTGPLAELAKAEAELEAASKAGNIGGGAVIKANAKVLAAKKAAREAGLLT